VKYADDCYLIVPASNPSSTHAELDHICALSRDNKQSLNTTKFAELIVRRIRSSHFKGPPPLVCIDRVVSLKMLRSVIFRDLKNVERLIRWSSQTLFAPLKLYLP